MAVVNEGNTIEIYKKGGGRKLLLSFVAKHSMCKKILDRMLVFKYNLDLNEVTVKITRGKRK